MDTDTEPAGILATDKEVAMNAQFQAALRYSKQIPKMKQRNRREGVRRLLAKIKDAIGK